jgi:hypothetical protein
MDINAIDKSIEVHGSSLGAILEGFKAFRSVALKYMSANGLTSSKTGTVDTEKWYSLKDWLKAYYAIEKEVGSNVLFDIGESIPKNAKFPPHIIDIDSVMKSAQVAYCMNHRRAGQVMFNPATGTLLEGIGHYGYNRSGQEKKISMICDNPYPCRFDHGIITAMAKKFEPRASVVHEDKKPCRARGGGECTYTVTW